MVLKNILHASRIRFECLSFRGRPCHVVSFRQHRSRLLNVHGQISLAIHIPKIKYVLAEQQLLRALFKTGLKYYCRFNVLPVTDQTKIQIGWFMAWNNWFCWPSQEIKDVFAWSSVPLEISGPILKRKKASGMSKLYAGKCTIKRYCLLIKIYPSLNPFKIFYCVFFSRSISFQYNIQFKLFKNRIFWRDFSSRRNR